jgi:hypothetical protein
MQVALELNDFQTAIITSNTQLRQKAYILRTLVSLLPFDKKTKDQFNGVLTGIENAYGKRNMIAHDAFTPSSNGEGVSFSVTRARGKLSFPETVWDIPKFEQEYAEIETFRSGVAQIIDAINHKQIIDSMRETGRAHPAALYYYTGGGFFWPGVQDVVQNPPFPLLHSSDTDIAAPKTDDQTPPADPE